MAGQASTSFCHLSPDRILRILLRATLSNQWELPGQEKAMCHLATSHLVNLLLRVPVITHSFRSPGLIILNFKNSTTKNHINGASHERHLNLNYFYSRNNEVVCFSKKLHLIETKKNKLHKHFYTVNLFRVALIIHS